MRRGINIGLILITWAAYAHSIGNGFVDLDDPLISANPHVLSGLSGESLAWAWTTLHGSLYQPLTWMSLQLDAELFGGQPGGFHFTNLILHTVNVLLVFNVLAWITSAAWRSAFVAALFALHPMHVESVSWIAERKDMLFTFFWLMMIAAHCWYARRTTVRRYALVLLAFVAGLLSKPMILTAPFVLLLLDAWPLRRLTPGAASTAEIRRGLAWAIMEKIPLFLLSLCAAFVTTYTMSLADSALFASGSTPLMQHFARSLIAYGWYLKSTFIPVGLAFYYRHDSWLGVDALQAMLSAMALLCITAAVSWQGRRVPALIVGWLWFLGTLLPVVAFSQAGQQLYSDRYAYFPHIGLFITISWAAAELFEFLRTPRYVRRLLAVGIMISLAALSWLQVRKWQDAEASWQNAVAVSPDNHRAHRNLAMVYASRGDLDKAHRHLRNALAIVELPAYHLNLAMICKQQGNMDAFHHHVAAHQRLRMQSETAPKRKRSDLLELNWPLQWMILALFAFLLAVPPLLRLWSYCRNPH